MASAHTKQSGFRVGLITVACVVMIGATALPHSATAAETGTGSASVVSLEKPGKVSSIWVPIRPLAPLIYIRWRAPTTGGEPTRYVIRIQYVRNNKYVYSTTVRAPSTRLLVFRAKLLEQTLRSRGDLQGSLRYRVHVQAANAAGLGPASVTYMSVRP